MNKTYLMQTISTALGATLVLLVVGYWVNSLYLKNTKPIGIAAPALSVAPIPIGIPAIFGSDEAETEVAAPTLPADLQLAGVIAGGSRSVALLTVDGKIEAFGIGQTVSPGIVLESVQAGQVTLKVGGRSVTLELPDKASAPATAPKLALTPNAQIVQKAPVPAVNLNVQSVGPNHFSVSRAEVNKALQDPAQAHNMGRAEVSPSGGLLLSDVPPGSVPDRLGIRTADILKSVNGRAITGLGDLPKLYKEFASAPTVNLDIYRNGQGALLQYTLRP